ncbi:hypothetical protein [Pantoea sp. BAV 3049]|uniref:hypothetical protein n=1 Tax=Pantoea sp. BAV 3049 TaxID=2654188 RepID=UPI00131AD354|nr:hypothetical protein [Pantoea sp. BAV 3049]
MASEYFIRRQLDALMEEPTNRDDGLWVRTEQDPVKKLEQLTRHHNGRIRQRAVLCLGLMHEVSTLPSFFNTSRKPGRAVYWLKFT